MKIQYNIYENIEQRRFNLRKPGEAILYDPIKERNSAQGPVQRNVAPPGSLLKVWEGQLELTKETNPSCKMLSTLDIKLF